ncbi:hypothetical protein HY416_00455 [Candidatus Kaiserbacteria bacterium]|nr:hypothetical protein [Candidatus Kaiserbacteria bacterium]
MGSTLTQSAQQTLKFFEEFIRRKEVADFIKKYRAYLNLPPSGLSLTKEDERELKEGVLPHLYIPTRAREAYPKDEKEKPFRVVNTCLAFTGQQGVKLWSVGLMLLHYLFFNRITAIPVNFLGTNRDDLLRLEYLPDELLWFDNEDHFLLKCMYEHFDEVSKTHPVVLYINPEVSQRQIQDFLAKNWAEIEQYRKDVKSPITGPRKKNKRTQERNDFIYEHRQLPRKEIMHLLYDKYGAELDIDYGYIGKIISLEKKRREKK